MSEQQPFNGPIAEKVDLSKAKVIQTPQQKRDQILISLNTIGGFVFAHASEYQMKHLANHIIILQNALLPDLQ